MRMILDLLVPFTAAVAVAMLATPAAHADPPRTVELPPVVITARGPTVFTTIPRARVELRREEPRAHLVREVAPTVRRAPF